MIVDPADIADHVRSELAERVLAEEPRLDLHSGKTVAVDREARHFLIGQTGTQRQALEVLGFLEQPLETLAVARLDLDEASEPIDGLVEVPHARGGYFERVRRIALRQHDAVAIGDDAAIGNDRHDGDPIAFGERLIVPMLEDLQIHEAAQEACKTDHDQCGSDDQPAPKEEELALRIPELGRPEAGARALAVDKKTAAHR